LLECTQGFFLPLVTLPARPSGHLCLLNTHGMADALVLIAPPRLIWSPVPACLPACLQAGQSHSAAEPAAATAHNTGARSAHTAATQPSQQGPATSHLGRSNLATVSTGNGERAGGSVEMGLMPEQQDAQHATSAPAVLRVLEQEREAAAAAAAAATGAAVAPHGCAAAAAQQPIQPAASAPAVMPHQQEQMPLQQLSGGAGLAGTPGAAQPAISVSMSGQGDTPGAACYGSGGITAGLALPQSSAAAAPLAAAHRHFGGGLPFALAAHASVCEGPHPVGAPLTDARSRSQGGCSGPCV
jgi:hypothetical protein